MVKANTTQLAHARFAPSASDRWIACPASIPFAEWLGIEERPASYAAAEGTAAHSVRALCIELGFDAADFVGTTFEVDGHSIEFTDDMALDLQTGIDRIAEARGEIYIERRVNLGEFLPDQFGTLDLGVIDGNQILIDDLKFGRYPPVNPQKPAQIRIYALGFWYEIARERLSVDDFVNVKFTLRIDQPRNFSGGGTAEIGLADLMAFGDVANEAYRNANSDNPRFDAGVHCKYCDALGQCPTAFDFFSQYMKTIGDAKTMPEFMRLQSKKKRTVAVHASLIKSWVDAVSEAAVDDVKSKGGTDVKLVEGQRGRRVYIDEKAAEEILSKYLGDEAYAERQLITPTAALKALAKNKEAVAALQEVVHQPEGRAIVVPSDDRRPSILTADAFIDIIG